MATTLRFNIVARDKSSRVFDQIGRRSGLLGRNLGAFGAVATGALKGAALAAGAFGVAAAKVGLQTAAGLQRAEVAFGTLLDSGVKARKFLDELKAFSIRTPFELSGLTDAATKLLGVGIEAKKVIPILTDLGDTSAAFGLSQAQFEGVLRGVTQAMAKGRIQAEELLQISEAGIPIYTLLSKALGKPIPEILKLSKEGKLLAEDVFPKLFKVMRQDFGGTMAAQMDTLGGAWNQLTEAFKLGAADAVQPLIPLIQDGLSGAAQQAFVVFGKLKGVFETVTPLIKAFMNGLRGGSSFGGGPIVQATEAGAKLRDILEKIGTTLRPVVQGFKDLAPAARNVLQFFGNLATAAGNFFKELIDGSKPLGGSVVDTINNLSETLADLPLGKLGTEFGKLVAKILDDAKPAFDALATAAKGALKFVKGILNFVADHPDAFTAVVEGVLAATAAYKALKVATQAATAAQLLFNAAFSVGPLGRFAAAVGLLAAGLAYLEQKTGLVTLAMRDQKRLFQSWGDAIVSALLAIDQAIQTLASGALLHFKTLTDSALRWAEDTVRAAAVAAGAFGRSGLAKRLNDAADNIANFRKSTQKSFDGAIEKIQEWGEAIDKMKKEVKLRADIRDLQAKLDRARRTLKEADKNISKKREAKLRADISQLRQAVRRAKEALRSVRSRRVVLTTVRRTVYQTRGSTRRPGAVITAQHGRMHAPSGLILVGEAGPELVAFAGGERIFTAGQTRKKLATLRGRRGTEKPIKGAPRAGKAKVEVHFHNHAPIGSQQQLNNWLVRSFDELNRAGRLRGVTI